MMDLFVWFCMLHGRGMPPDFPEKTRLEMFRELDREFEQKFNPDNLEYGKLRPIPLPPPQPMKPMKP